MANVTRFPTRPRESRARDHAWGDLLDRVQVAVVAELEASGEHIDAAGLGLFADELREQSRLVLDEAWGTYSERVHGRG